MAPVYPTDCSHSVFQSLCMYRALSVYTKSVITSCHLIFSAVSSPLDSIFPNFKNSSIVPCYCFLSSLPYFFYHLFCAFSKTKLGPDSLVDRILSLSCFSFLHRNLLLPPTCHWFSQCWYLSFSYCVLHFTHVQTALLSLLLGSWVLTSISSSSTDLQLFSIMESSIFIILLCSSHFLCIASNFFP